MPSKRPPDKDGLLEPTPRQKKDTPPSENENEEIIQALMSKGRKKSALKAAAKDNAEKPKRSGSVVMRFFKKWLSPDTIPGLALALFTIAACAALALGVVNMFTARIIEEQRQAAIAQSMRAVIAADRFEALNEEETFFAAYNGDTLVGYTVAVSVKGYGPIELIVGVSPTAAVLDVAVVSHNETPGYGSAITTDPGFLQQFQQHSLPLSYGSDGLDAISGATLTSKAALSGIQQALKTVMEYTLESEVTAP